MNEKETKPPITTVTRKVVGEEQDQEQPVTVGNIAIIALIVALSTPVMLLIGHALPLLDSFFNGMKPLVSYIGFCTGVALFVLLALCVWYAHDRFRVDIKRRIIEAGKFQVDSNSGNYDAYLDEKKQFLVPSPGTLVQPVPQTITLAPQWHIKGSVSKGDERANQPLLEQGNVQKPSVDELASKVERNSLQVGLGRSLTTGKDLIAELNGTHTKIIGGTQMGKSCMAGVILAQAEITHDPDRLQFALLDMEYQTSKLFEKSAHLARVDVGRGREVRLHAKTIDDVPTHLHYIVEELERRNRLENYQDTEKLPHILIYIEEFLDLKKRLKIRDKKVYEQFLVDFNTLTTRGLKLGLHVMACAQVDYADDDLKDAMAQFIGLNLAFGVKPSAAIAAGFISSDLLSQNFASKIPGQFVLETLGGSDLGIAPDYDVKKKLNALSQTKILGTRETRDLSLECGLNVNGTWMGTQIETALEAYSQYKVPQVLDAMESGVNTKDGIIDKVWQVKKGKGQGYYNACLEYEQAMLFISQMARKSIVK